MFASYFINRPNFAFVISILVVLLGLSALKAIPISEYPDITPPQIKVTATYPGANAGIVEQAVATPIEAQVNGVENMLYMSSTSSNNGGYELTITFKVGTDPDVAAINVQNRVAIANSQLPAEVTRNGVITRKQSSNILLLVNLVSPNNTHDALFISNYASLNLQDRMSRIEGVGSVAQLGAKDYGMRIWLDTDRLTNLGLTSEDIATAIREQNVQATAGQLGAPPFDNIPQFEYTLQAKGDLNTVEEFEDIIIRSNSDGSLLHLQDVARIELASQSYSAVAKLNHQPTSAIAIYQSPGANALSVADAIYEELDKAAENFPEDLEFKILFDTTKSVRSSINEVVETLVITFLLVVAVTFLFLGDWRSTVVPTLAIPVSLIGAIAIMYGLGYSINMITLFALILAVGIVVDDSIVVVENVQRIMDESGLSAPEATAKAMSEVSSPIIATTLVLLAVFVPVSMMPGVTGQLYTQFSVTICAAVVLSSINALTLSPALCAIMLRPSTGEKKGLLRYFSKGVDKAKSGYVWTVKHMIRAAAFSILAFVGFGVAAFMLFKITPTGFLPTEDKGAFFAHVQLPDGASLNRTELVMTDVSDKVLDIDGIESIIAVSGFSFLTGSVSNAGLAIVTLDDWNSRASKNLPWWQTLGEINGQLARIPAAQAFAFPLPPISGLGSRGGVEAQIQDTLGRSPQELASAVRSMVFAANQRPELENASSSFAADVPQLFLDVDRERAELIGVSITDIFSTLQANLGSQYINDFNLYGKSYRVIIQAESKDRDSVEDIYRLRVRSDSGDMVPLRTLIDVKPQLGPLSLTRYNQLRTANIAASVSSSYGSGDAIKAMEEVAAEALPEGYVLEWTGSTKQELEAGGLVIMIFAAAYLFAYLFLVAQYESWALPNAVMLPIIIAITGAMLPLAALPLPWLTNNLYAQIGIVMLIGLASKSAILIVEFAVIRRASGDSIFEASINAANLRYRAVLMTALSFILGVMPLMFASGAGSASRSVVGFVVFSGMVFATLIGTLFVPVLYYSLQKLRERANRYPKA